MIKVADIQSVYSGINGRCCCGCSGKHSYASQYRELASKGIGYQVTCNDRTVKMIVNKINSLENNLSCKGYNFYKGEYVSVVVGNRIYIAYFAKK